MGTVLSISVNNILLAVWLYFLILEPRFERAVTVCLVLAWFAALEIFGWATLDWTRGAPFLIFAFGFCIVVAYHLGACLLLSRAHPLKVTFLYFTFFQNVWTAVFILQNILSRNVLTWNLVGVGLNVIILPPFVLYLKRYYLRVCREVESGYGLVAAIAALEFFIMSIILLYTPYEPEFSAQKIAFLLSLLTLAAVVHFLLFRVLAHMNMRKQIEHMELQRKILLTQIEAYEQMEQEALRRNHDARHHITALTEMISNGEREHALAYLKQYEVATRSEEQRFCEHSMVNTIVSAYARRARRDGIILDARISLGRETNVSDIDFVVILANILENALHACREVPGGSVSLDIKRKGMKLVIVCVNPCRRGIAFRDGLPDASPRDGIGVKSIIHTARKYNGDADFSVDTTEDGGKGADMFKCAVILNDTPRDNL